MPPDSADETARGWLDLADRDMQVVAALDHDAHPEMVLFHCQQVVEKTLKAVIIASGAVPPFVHSVERLIAALPDAHRDVPSVVAETSDLMFEAYVESRYDPFGDPPTAAEVRSGVAAADAALTWARTVVSSYRP